MIDIPELASTAFQEISFRFHFNEEALLHARGEDFFDGSDWALDGVDLQGEFAHLTGGPDPEEGLTAGVEVELKLRRFPHRASEVATIENISTALNALSGVRAYVVVVARYSVNRSSLPAEGVVNSMLGVKTRAGGEELLLSGASFLIRGFRNDSVSWFVSPCFVSPGKTVEMIAGSITRETHELLHERLLSDEVYLAQSRLSRLILEEVHNDRSATVA